MKTIKKVYRIFWVFFFLPLAALAQKEAPQRNQKNDKEIHVELRNEVGGEPRVFNRNYSSREEMLADQELKDFLQTENLNAYFFSKQEQPGFYTYRAPGIADHEFYLFRSDSLMDYSYTGDTSYFFTPDFGRGFVFPLPRDSGMQFWLPFHTDSMYTTPLKPFELDSIRKIWEEKMEMAGGSGFFYSFGDELGNLENRLQVIRDKKVSISELKKGEELLFGFVKEMDELEPEEIRYLPNPGSGRFHLLLELKSEKPLQVSVMDINGKIIYEEEVKTFDGSYRKEFDLRAKEEGIYLLRVVQGGKHLLRKIIIN